MSDDEPISQQNYNDDAWENDPFLTMTPERTARAKIAAMQYMQMMNVRPSAIKEEQIREEYVAWLKANPK